jgi:capsular polysaccharide biosynthesis protein
MSIERSEDIRSDAAWDVGDADEDQPGGPVPAGLVTLRYLWDAVRRHARLWLVTAAVGLLAGIAFPFVLPAASVASTKLLLTHQPGDDALSAMATDVSLATTDTVARRVIDRLGLEESPPDLLKQYTVTSPTDRILQISVSAPTAGQAVRLAQALGTTYLDFRMEQVRARQEPVKAQLAQARDRLQRLEKNRAKRTGQNGTGAQDQPADDGPGTPISQANDQVTQLQQTLNAEKAAAALVSSSHVLDPAAVVPKSALKTTGLDVLTGLGAGMVLGIGFVLVRALLSDRLWRRQVVAEALGARVTLSLPQVKHKHWWRALSPIVPRMSSATELSLAARRLRELVARQVTVRKTLVVVAGDDVTPAAIIVARLAEQLAADGQRVVVADLSGRDAVARELVPADLVTVHTPEGDGPHYGRLDAEGDAADEQFQLAWDLADVVLTLSAVSAALGADHLATWGAEAVVVVTAGHSSATHVHTTGELIRLAGVRLATGILVGSDKNDETAGVPSDEATAVVASDPQEQSAVIQAGGWRG